jgi:hypothetical protein
MAGAYSMTGTSGDSVGDAGDILAGEGDPCCCGGSPNCGCARRLKLDFSNLSGTTVDLNADGSITATLPTFTDTTINVEIPSGKCYYLSGPNPFGNSPATYSGTSSGTFDIYLLVWWSAVSGPPGELNIAVLELASGATWDRLALIFGISLILDTCCTFINGGGVSDTDTGSIYEQPASNTEAMLTFTDDIVADGLFPTNTVTFVNAQADDSYPAIFINIRCCPTCFVTDDQPDADITLSGGSHFTVPWLGAIDFSDPWTDCEMSYGAGNVTLAVVAERDPTTNALTGLYIVELVTGASTFTPERYLATGVTLDCVDGVLTGSCTVTSESDPSHTAVVVLG